MKVQVLKDVDICEITNHSLKPEDNQYYATMDGVCSDFPNGSVFEVYRVDYSDDFKFYMNNSDAEVSVCDMQNLRQLITLEIATPAHPEPPPMEQVLLIKQFRAQTGLGLLEAKHWLSISEWDCETALNKFTHSKG